MQEPILKNKNLKPSWDDAKIALLGTMPDAELAKRFGIKHHVVLYKRMTLGISAFKDMTKRKWSRSDIRMLGTKSDDEVANLLGLSKTTVSNKRLELGIDAFAYKSELWRIWTKTELSLLGKHTDKEVARRLKMSTSGVAAKRHLHGITPFHPRAKSKTPSPNAVKWTRRDLKLLGKIPDKRLSEIMGISRKSVMTKRKKLGIESYALGTQFWHQWTEDEIARLGKSTDKELAKQLGVEPMCVMTKRRQLGINSFSKTYGTKKTHIWTKREIAMLGKKTDTMVAHELGIGIGLVRKKRIELGITAYMGSGRSAEKWTPAILARLGKEPLQKLADEIGVSREAVRQKCVKLGIMTRAGRK